MNTNKKTPKLRFKGFTDDWEQRKLKSIANTIVAGGDIDKNKIKESGTYPVIANALTKDGVVGYYEDAYRIEAPAVTVTGRGDIGVAKARHQNFTPVVRLLSLTTAHDVDFIEHAINNLKIVSESTGVAQLTVPQLSNYKIHITSLLEERKIGLFISKVDNLITLHQRKLEKLKLNKSALLQKLFPQKGCTIPDVRFKGFTDAWEQRKLGDFYTFKNGLNKEKVYFGYGDSIVNFTDVFHNRQIYSSTLKGKVCVNKKELENYKVKEGDLFFTRTSETIDEIGFPAVVMEPMERVVFSGFVLRGRAEKYDPLANIFKSYIFFTDNFRSEMKKKSSMTTRALTSGTALKEMYFSYPKDLEEQTKIGEILLRLDKIITLHQRKLDCLKSIKKGLLQQLFV